MGLDDNDFCCMEFYDKHFWCMEVNSGNNIIFLRFRISTLFELYLSIIKQNQDLMQSKLKKLSYFLWYYKTLQLYHEKNVLKIV